MKDFEIILVVIGSAFLFISALSDGKIQSRILPFVVGVTFLIAGIATYTGWIQKNPEKLSPSSVTSPSPTPASPTPASSTPAR